MTWAALSEFATRLADSGAEVTQIHHRGEIPAADWSHDSHSATLVAGAEFDCVVLADGTRVLADEQQAADLAIAQQVLDA